MGKSEIVYVIIKIVEAVAAVLKEVFKNET